MWCICDGGETVNDKIKDYGCRPSREVGGGQVGLGLGKESEDSEAENDDEEMNAVNFLG